MNLLRAEGITAGYGAHDDILKDVAIDVAQGEIVAILGPNGAGKSTLLKTIAGLLTPRTGGIGFAGENIAGLRPREVSRRGVVFVPQDNNMFPSLSVQENLEIAAWLDRHHYRARLAAVYDRMPEIAARRGVRAGTLSGGQRQSLAMAMALMVGPKLMMLDEPTAGLSPIAAEILFNTMHAIRADGISVAMVEQNATLALKFADRAYILVDGRNARDGEARAMLHDPQIRALFLGEA